MYIVKIEKRDTHLNVDLSLAEIYYLKSLFDNAAIEFNSENDPLAAKAADWLDDEFYPFLKEITEKIEG